MYVQLGLADDALSVLESEPTAATGEPDEEDMPALSSELEPLEQKDQNDQVSQLTDFSSTVSSAFVFSTLFE